MSPSSAKSRILAFLKNHNLAVISTVDLTIDAPEKTKPESAVVSFAEKESLEVVVGTSNTTRKYKNLEKCQNVSLAIGWDPRVGTVQYDGVARELSGAEANEHANMQVAKNPFSKMFMERADQRYFLITPTWIRLTDMAKKPEETIELDCVRGTVVGSNK